MNKVEGKIQCLPLCNLCNRRLSSTHSRTAFFCQENICRWEKSTCIWQHPHTQYKWKVLALRKLNCLLNYLWITSVGVSDNINGKAEINMNLEVWNCLSNRLFINSAEPLKINIYNCWNKLGTPFSGLSRTSVRILGMALTLVSFNLDLGLEIQSFIPSSS